MAILQLRVMSDRVRMQLSTLYRWAELKQPEGHPEQLDKDGLAGLIRDCGRKR